MFSTDIRNGMFHVLPGLMIVLLMVGCTENSVIDTFLTSRPSDSASEMARVEQVDVMVLESFPLQIHVTATGYLPDGCFSIGQVTTERDGTRFNITILAERTSSRDCEGQEAPFEEVIPLDVLGLKAGVYKVVVNGVDTSFRLDVDNEFPTETLPPEEIGGDDGQTSTIEIHAGEVFTVKLESNPTAGYRWELAQPLNERLLELVGTEYHPTPATQNLVGAGGVEIWSFKGLSVGETVLSFGYARPWEASAISQREFTVRIR